MGVCREEGSIGLSFWQVPNALVLPGEMPQSPSYRTLAPVRAMQHLSTAPSPSHTHETLRCSP